MKTIKIKKIGKLLLAILIFVVFYNVLSYVFGFDSIFYKSFCVIRGGRIFGYNEKICIFKYEDAGKECFDNEECLDFCIIPNKEIIRKKLQELGNGFNITTEIFEKETGIKIEKGYCNDGIYEYWCSEPEAYVENGFVYIGTEYSCEGIPRKVRYK